MPATRPAQPILGLPRPLAQTALLAARAEAELSSRELLRGQREVVIRHGDQVYRLRHTRNDKLILTK
jgi:hemin uptake protein HemP